MQIEPSSGPIFHLSCCLPVLPQHWLVLDDEMKLHIFLTIFVVPRDKIGHITTNFDILMHFATKSFFSIFSNESTARVNKMKPELLSELKCFQTVC